MKEKIDIPLSPEEAEFLKKYYSTYTRRKVITQQINQWKKYSTELIVGFPYISIDEYYSRLWLRHIIEQFLGECTSSLKEKLMPRIQEADDIYCDNTIKVDIPLLDFTPDNEETPWWYYRIPKRMPAELEETFRRGGWIS